MTDRLKHTIVIAGGGAAGLSVASSLLKQEPHLDIAIIEPSEYHYYQPAWTLVGGGAFNQSKTRRKQIDCIPKGARWIKDSVASFDPENNQIILASGKSVEYRHLVVALGIQINWNQIEGLEETLGKHGVTSNYHYNHAPYTWECLKNFKGGRALFTQPELPIKCAGAPQKIAYLASDLWRKKAIAVDAHFYAHAETFFSVPFYAKELEKVAASYGVKRHHKHLLIAVDGPQKIATFKVIKEDGTTENIQEKFDFLHVTPPQSAPDVVKQSTLANAGGWVAVNKNTLRHDQYSNIYSLGDCSSIPTSKTAAAVHQQAPVLVANLLADIRQTKSAASYDGYTACPVTTSYGKVLLAEFTFDGVVTPSFPLDPRVPHRSKWFLKKYFFPYLYWNGMLKGRDWKIPHRVFEA